MLKGKFSILSANNLIFLLLGAFLTSAVFFVWFLLQNRPLNYTYISRPLNKAEVAVVTTAPVIINPSLVQGTAVKKININTASLSDLDKLSGIGLVRAQKIVEGRPYQRIEDLIINKIIPRSVYEQIKDKITIGN